MQPELGLGALFQLPPEIRLQIWDHLPLFPSLCKLPDPHESLTSGHLIFAILQTSRWLRDEICNFFYKDVVLRFHVVPEYQYQSWITVEKDPNITWQLQDLDDGLSRGFGQMPLEKLKGTVIEINAPSPEDPGQVICLWQKCLDLAQLLETHNERFPRLEIILTDSASAQWFRKGRPQRNIAIDQGRRRPLQDNHFDYLYERPKIVSNDIQLVLRAFYRLRSAQDIRVSVPNDMRQAFQLSLHADNPEYDEILRAEYDQTFMDLDIELDVLPSVTANMLRLERFSSWCSNGYGSESRYERRLERILRNSCPVCKDGELRLRIQLFYLQNRFVTMLEFHPWGLFHWRNEEKWLKVRRPGASNDADVQKEFDLEKTKVLWNRDIWRGGHFRNGIALFDGEHFWKRCATEDSKVAIGFERNFCAKLQDWVGDYDVLRPYGSVLLWR